MSRYLLTIIVLSLLILAASPNVQIPKSFKHNVYYSAIIQGNGVNVPQESYSPIQSQAWVSGKFEESGGALTCDYPVFTGLKMVVTIGYQWYCPYSYITGVILHIPICISLQPTYKWYSSNNVEGWIGFPSNVIGATGGPFSALGPLFDWIEGFPGTSEAPPNPNDVYFNFFNISTLSGSVYSYQFNGLSNVDSVVLTDFTVVNPYSNAPVPGIYPSTLIIPAATCGYNFATIGLNSLGNFLSPISGGVLSGIFGIYQLFYGVTPIPGETGIVPAIGIANENQGPGGVTYIIPLAPQLGAVSTYNYEFTGIFSGSTAYHYSSDFAFQLPTLNPAPPQLNYLTNSSFFFATPMPATLFNLSVFPDNEWIYVYVDAPGSSSPLKYSGNPIFSFEMNQKNYNFLTYEYPMNSTQISSAISNQESILKDIYQIYSSNTYNVWPGPIENISALPIPLLDTLYTPVPYLYGQAYAYPYFSTDAVFPVCSWDTQINNVYPNCTLYSPHINPIVYSYFFDMSKSESIWNEILSFIDIGKWMFPSPFILYLNKGGPETGSETFLTLANQAGAKFPIYFPQLLALNNITQIAAASFCFYGESYSASGYPNYISPNYSRYIYPDEYEGYSVPVGFCNAFYSNTNCFGFGNNINLKEGIISTNVVCTPKGINASISDNWITSIILANSEGYGCGFLKGEKNLSNPNASYTQFLQNITTCPAFNYNGFAHVIVTVKNVGNTPEVPFFILVYNVTPSQLSNYSTWYPVIYAENNSLVKNQSLAALYGYYAWEALLQYPMQTSTNISISLRWTNGQESILYSPTNSPYSISPIYTIYDDRLLSLSPPLYTEGPFPNHLLAIFARYGGYTIRSANVIATLTNGSGSLPFVYPNQTIVFDIQVPASILKSIRSLYAIVGNLVNVSWVTYQNTVSIFEGPSISGNPNPYYVIRSSGPDATVNPLIISGSENLSLIHNNEIVSSSSSSPIPPWQFEASAFVNLTRAPFNTTKYYNFSTMIINATPPKGKALNSELKVNVSSIIQYYFQGKSKVYNASSSAFNTTCFVSPDLLNDFGIYWIKQSFHPYSLNTLLEDIGYTNPKGKLYDVVINAWKGLLFTPFYAPMVLNYNNIVSNQHATLEMPIQLLNTSENSMQEYLVLSNLGNNPNSLLSQLKTSLSVLKNITLYPSTAFDYSIYSLALVNQSNGDLYVYIGLTKNSLTTSSSNNVQIGNIYSPSGINAIAYIEYPNGTLAKCGSGSAPQYQISDAYMGSYYKIQNGFICQGYENNPYPLDVLLFNETTYAFLGSLQIIPGPIATYLGGNTFNISIPGIGPITTTANITEIQAQPNNINVPISINSKKGSVSINYIAIGIPIIKGKLNLANALGQPPSSNYYYGIIFYYDDVPYTVLINGSNFNYVKTAYVYPDNPKLIQNIEINPTSSSTFIFLNIPLSNCNDVRFISESNEYLPFQTMFGLNGMCYYAVLYKGPTSLTNLTVEEYTFTPPYSFYVFTPPAISIHNGMANVSYPINLTYYEECLPNYGPCLQSGSNYIMFDNVSISQINAFYASSGPLFSCIVQNFNAYSNEILPYKVSGIRYSDIYQVYSGSENVNTEYCFSNYLSNMVAQFIFTNGIPVNFYVSNIVNKSFNSVYFDNTKVVSSYGTNLGCASYGTISSCSPSFSEQSYLYHTLGLGVGNAPVPTKQPGTGNDVPIPNVPSDNSFYCIMIYPESTNLPNYKYIPITYTSEGSYDSSLNVLPVGSQSQTYLAYIPGVYDINGNYSYYDCGLLNYNGPGVLQSPQPTIPSSPGAFDSTASLLVNPSGGVLIGQCPANTTIVNASLCTKTFSYQNSNLIANFYSEANNPYCLPQVFANYIPGYNSLIGNAPIGGGCLVNSQYSCAPIYGKFKIPFPNATGESNSAQTTAANRVIYYNYIYTSAHPLLSSNYITYTLSWSYFANASANCTTTTSTSSGTQTTWKIIKASVSGSYTTTININNQQSYSYSISNPSVQFTVTTTFTPTPNSTYNLQVNSYASINAQSYLYSQLEDECSGGSLSQLTYYSNISISGYGGNWDQSAPVQYDNTNSLCYNVTVNNVQPIEHDVGIGLSWSPFYSYQYNIPTTDSGGIPLIGECEACRDVFNVTLPIMTTQQVGKYTFVDTYSCPTGYSGSIYACRSTPQYEVPIQISQVLLEEGINRYLRFIPTLSCASSEVCKACNVVSGFTGATPPNCIGYGIAMNGSTPNIAVQYDGLANFGIGLGASKIVVNGSYHIPSQAPIKEDAYMTNLQVGEQEMENLIIPEYPNPVFEQPYKIYALSAANVLPYSMYTFLEDYNPQIGLIGTPFELQNVYDFAASLYGSGTSNNCNISLAHPARYNLYQIGEGAVCSGEDLPSSYSNGIYIPLGQLNAGVHTIALDSISENGTTTNPIINVFNQYGPANIINCSGAVLTISSANGSMTFTKDMNCDNIEALFRGYIIDCISYSTKLNGSIYFYNQSYYNAVFFPTVWQITYTLLVAPKSYTEIPVPLSPSNGKLVINLSEVGFLQ